ncbi:UNVERIFIED_CONTAM: hypothetical protein GTU68_059322 [Idotea baltica]|nr:hypothetical protein [Idotea baltica]
MLKICLWKSFYLEWLDETRPQDIYVVHYETLKENNIDVLRGILKFLHLSVDKHRFECLAKHSNGPFKRKPSRNVQNTKDLFSKEMKKAIYEAIHAVNTALVQRGKDPLPVHLYEFYEAQEAETVKQKVFL